METFLVLVFYLTLVFTVVCWVSLTLTPATIYGAFLLNCPPPVLSCLLLKLY